MPEVSVIMTVFNEEKYLRDAVSSILSQTFEDLEFLIINDGSTDESPEILEKIRDSRIRILNQENRGLTASLNRGIIESRGKFIARMDADDISHPNRIEYQIAYLREHPRVGLLGTRTAFIDEKSCIVGAFPITLTDAHIRKRMRKGNIIFHGSVMFRRSCIDEVGLYREIFTCSQDYDLWLRISEKFQVANLPEILYFWRINSEGITYRNHKRLMEEARFIKELANTREHSGDDHLDEKAAGITAHLDSIETGNQSNRTIADTDYHKKIAFGAFFMGEYTTARKHLRPIMFRRHSGLLPLLCYIVSFFRIGFRRITGLAYGEHVSKVIQRNIK